MNNYAEKFVWPIRELPQIKLCGRFFHKADNFNVKYKCDINALHIYEYDGIVRLGSQQFPFKAGDITITPIGETSTYKLNKNGLHYCVHFKAASHCDEKIAVNKHISLANIIPPAGEQIKKAIQIFNCPVEDSRQRRVNESIASAMFLEAILMLSGSGSTGTVGNVGKIADLLALIDLRLADDLTIPQLAKEVGLSQNYLSAMFKKRLGTTIKQYILNRKMAKAKYLLSSTQMQVKAIATEVGMSDQQYFNNKFTQTQGKSPLKYRQKQDNLNF